MTAYEHHLKLQRDRLQARRWIPWLLEQLQLEGLLRPGYRTRTEIARLECRENVQ